MLAFWFGEARWGEPGGRSGCSESFLDAGDTFYGPTLGLPQLRQSLAHYLSALHRPVGVERIAITNSACNGLMLACQAILSPGDRVVAVVPLWPNLVEIPAILGAEVDRVSLVLDPHGRRRWRLDLDVLLERLRPGTRAVLINSPNNPTGWVMTAQDQAALLAHCRRHDIWILSDEAYDRLVFDPSDGSHALSETPPAGPVGAPSMLDLAQCR